MILLFLAESWSQEAGGSSPQTCPFRFVPVLPCTHSSCLQLNTLRSLNSSEQHWVVDKHLFHSSQSRAAGYRQVWCNEFHSGPQGAFRWALLCPGCQSSWYHRERKNTALISSSPSLSRSGIPRNHTTPFSLDRIGEQDVPGILMGVPKRVPKWPPFSASSENCLVYWAVQNTALLRSWKFQVMSTVLSFSACPIQPSVAVALDSEERRQG